MHQRTKGRAGRQHRPSALYCNTYWRHRQEEFAVICIFHFPDHSDPQVPSGHLLPRCGRPAAGAPASIPGVASEEVVDEPGGDERVILPGSRSPLDPARALRSGAGGLPREEVREVQRERLIDAVVQVIAEGGYASAGVRVVCQRAGVAFNTFYEYFDTKEALFIAAFDAGTEIMLEEAGAAYALSEGHWEVRVEAAVGSFLQILADNPTFARFFAIEAHKIGPPAIGRIERTFAAAFAIFGDAEPASGLTMNAIEILPLAIGGIYADIYMYIRSGRTERLPELLPNLVEFVCTLFRSRPPRQAAKK